MDGFMYMSIQSRIQHQEEIARRIAAQPRRVKKKQPRARLAVAPPAGVALQLPETRNA